MGALVTTFYVARESNHRAYCGLKRWCHTADWAAANVVPGLDVLIITNMVELAQHECPNARVVPFNRGLVNMVSQWDTRSTRLDRGSRVTSSCPFNTLLKWDAVSPRHYRTGTRSVLYLDSDVDAGWMTSVAALKRYRFLQKLEEFEHDQTCDLRATPDHMAPVNTGIMLLKPSKSMFAEGMAVLRTRAFSLSTGFNGTGPPKEALAATVSGPHAQPLVMKARGYWTNSWDYVCGDGDQGLFSAMYQARHQRFCVPKYWDKELRVHHFWGGDKPWYNPPSCARYFMFLQKLPQTKRRKNATTAYGDCTAYLLSQSRMVKRLNCLGRSWPLI
jgi:hypothetical protein